MTDSHEAVGSAGCDRRRILVVDDEAGIRDTLVALIRWASERYDVETAGSGLEASVKLSSFRPDLVFLDLKLPDTEGLDLCRRIRELGNDETKIVILTGMTDRQNRERSLVCGADLFLSKPLTGESLRAHVAELLDP